MRRPSVTGRRTGSPHDLAGAGRSPSTCGEPRCPVQALGTTPPGEPQPHLGAGEMWRQEHLTTAAAARSAASHHRENVPRRAWQFWQTARQRQHRPQLSVATTGASWPASLRLPTPWMSPCQQRPHPLSASVVLGDHPFAGRPAGRALRKDTVRQNHCAGGMEVNKSQLEGTGKIK
eukprot:scaffold1021_cov108-Isochrysis_galbana.AAC.2